MWDEAAWVRTLVPAHLIHVLAYEPGKPVDELERELGISGAIKLASNENPLGPSARALAAINLAAPALHLYPDAGAFELRRALASRLGVDFARVFVGPGSNDLIYQLVLALCDAGDEVVAHAHAFLSYRLAARVSARTFVEAPADKACDVDALIAAFSPRTKLVIVGTPNNPTGTVLTKSEVTRILGAMPARAVLVLDEAYYEYARAWPELMPVDGSDFLDDPRVVVLRTFSKIYGLAGVRVGYGVGHVAVANALGRVTRTFSVSSLAQAAAIAALADQSHVEASRANARSCVERMSRELVATGIGVTPSAANFVLADFARPAGPIYEALLRLGVIVRPMAGWGLPTCLRISAALPHELDRALAAIMRVASSKAS